MTANLWVCLGMTKKRGKEMGLSESFEGEFLKGKFRIEIREIVLDKLMKKIRYRKI
jgi:hypothetical protein